MAVILPRPGCAAFRGFFDLMVNPGFLAQPHAKCQDAAFTPVVAPHLLKHRENNRFSCTFASVIEYQ
jgi:hypothetical protein